MGGRGESHIARRIILDAGLILDGEGGYCTTGAAHEIRDRLWVNDGRRSGGGPGVKEQQAS
jgi:hypothetical protein